MRDVERGSKRGREERGREEKEKGERRKERREIATIATLVLNYPSN